MRGLPLERIMLVEEDVRWMGGLDDLGGLVGVEVGVEEAGETVGKGTEGGFTRE